MLKKNKNLLTSGLVIATLVAGSFSTAAFAADEKWKVRLRGIGVLPDDSSNNISGSLGGLNAGVGVDESFVPELDVTYMITPNWGVEAIAGIAEHDVSISGNDATLLGIGPGIGDGFKIFDSWVLPPTVLLQYHFMPNNHIRPYVGVGVNYTATLFDDATDQLEAILGPVDVSTSNSWGYALQVGMDYDINESWFFNVDVKYIDIDTTAKLGFTGGNLEVDLDINPFVVGAGIGYRF